MDFFRQLFQQSTSFFNKMTAQQRVVMGVVASAVVLAVFGIILFGGPSYSTLYTNLNPQDAKIGRAHV